MSKEIEMRPVQQLMYRYPNSTQLTIDAFRASDWQGVIAEGECDGYLSRWNGFSDAARLASEAEEYPQARVLWVLADASSMMLKPESPSDPFSPRWVMEGRRSALPEDFKTDELDFMAAAVKEINDPWLKARLSDLLWLRGNPRSIEHARSAIDAYSHTGLDHETWIHEGRECWDRALALCRMLRGGAENRLEKIEADLLGGFQNSSDSEGNLPIWISQMLSKYGLCRDQSIEIGQRLTEFATTSEEGGDLYRSRNCYTEACQWYSIAGQKELEITGIGAIAESWVKEALAQTSMAKPNYMAGARYFEIAIQTYRRIPRAVRKDHDVDGKINEIRGEMDKCRELSLNEMGTIRSPPIDFADMVLEARASVQGKPASEALLAFSKVSNFFDFDRDKESAEKIIRDHPLQSLFGATHVSADGRVIAKTPAARLGAEGSGENRAVVRLQMVRHYKMGLDISVRGYIWPAREVLVAEHRFREDDLILLVRQSCLIPPDRAKLVGKALFFGFEGDFAAALHLLVPQIENLVRVHLKAAGHKTTTLDQDGIEQEKGLSALMGEAASEEVFGKDLAFEFRVLFCDAIGPNLRNEIAHGLLSDKDCQSIYAVYAWWFTFRLVFTTFWEALRRQPTDSIDDETTEESRGAGGYKDVEAERILPNKRKTGRHSS